MNDQSYARLHVVSSMKHLYKIIGAGCNRSGVAIIMIHTIYSNQRSVISHTYALEIGHCTDRVQSLRSSCFLQCNCSFSNNRITRSGSILTHVSVFPSVLWRPSSLLASNYVCVGMWQIMDCCLNNIMLHFAFLILLITLTSTPCNIITCMVLNGVDEFYEC